MKEHPEGIFDLRTMRWVLYAFVIGVAWADLQAQNARKVDRDEFIILAHDVRAIKVIVCRSTPNDSECKEP